MTDKRVSSRIIYITYKKEKKDKILQENPQRILVVNFLQRGKLVKIENRDHNQHWQGSDYLEKREF